MIKGSTIINKFHSIIYLYLVFGWLISLNSCKILVLFTPTVMVQWGVNNNECIFTQLENNLIKKENNNLVKQKDSFIDDMLKKRNIIITPQKLISYLI